MIQQIYIAGLILFIIFVVIVWFITVTKAKNKYHSLKGLNIKHFEILKDALQELIMKSGKLAITSGDFSKDSMTADKVSEQIAATIVELAEGATMQASQAHLSNEKMYALDTKLTELLDDAAGVMFKTNQAKLRSENSLQNIKELVDSTAENSDKTQAIIQMINKLNKDMKQIKEIITIITGISEQTNLLSLNAAIEAARAGEYGKGFSIVAQEIKKLSLQTKESSSSIEKKIQGISTDLDNVVYSADQMFVILIKQAEAVKNTQLSFAEIVNTTNAVATDIENISYRISEIDEIKMSAIELMDEIVGNSENSAACLEEMSSTTQELMASAQELSKFSALTADSAKGLESELSELSNKVNENIC